MLYLQSHNYIVNQLCSKNRWQIHSKKANNIKKETFRWNYKNYKDNNKNRIKCGALVFNKSLDKIVLIQNNYNLMKGEEKWGLPKGHREGNETYATCAKRELFEETGILWEIRDDMFKIRINNTYYFPIILDEKLIHLNPLDKNEIAQAAWIRIDDLENFNVNRETKIFIKRKLRSLMPSLKRVCL